MKKNVASQTIGAQLVSATDGSAVTSGTTTVYVTGDGGTQATTGSATHEGNGYWSYTPSQAQTNFDHVAFTFSNTSAVSATVQVFTSFPQTKDNATDITAILADTNELQGNQGDWATATGFATSGALATVDSNVDAILVDTGTTIPSQISGLNDFNPATDTVANVTLVATCTTNTDMRGTDSALLASGYTAPDNASIASILTDTGTTIPAQITALNDVSSGDVVTAMQAVADDFKADVSGLATQTSVDTIDTNVDAVKVVTDKLDTALVLDGAVYQYTTNALENAPSGGGGGGGDATAANQTTIINAISALNDFDPTTDTVARVTLCDTVTTNTDMRGTDGANTVAPDNASISAILVDTNDLQTNQGDWITATGFSTHSASDVWSVTTRETTGGTIDTNNDMRGTDSAMLASSYTAPDNASIDEAVEAAKLAAALSA